MKNWKKEKLGNVIKYIARGITPAYTEKSGVVVINQKCIRDNVLNFELSRLTDPRKRNINRDKYLKLNDIVVNSTGVGTLGRVAQYKKEFDTVTADSHVTIVRPDIDKIDPLYLGFAVYNKQSIIEAMGEGATGQTELSRDRLGDLDIEYPDDKNEQQKIASILSAYDDLIEVNNKRIKILEEMAQLIYKEWFVNFKFPGYEKVKIKNGLPEGWEVKKIGEIVDSIKQKYIDEKNEGLPLLDLGRIPRKSLSISEYGLSNEIKTARKIFDEDDILFGNIRVYFHKVIFGMKKGITNSSVFVLRAKNKKYQNFFLNYFFSEDIISWASQNSGGTKMPVIGWEVLKKKKIILPEEGIIKEYNNRTNWMLVLIKNLNLQNENLRKTRDLLLPKLMSGEIEV